VVLGAGANAAWDGWFVLNPGDQVVVQGFVPDVRALVSGAVLAGGPPFPPNA
jgi:hypothetical protein